MAANQEEAERLLEIADDFWKNDEESAFKYYQKAAALGNATAMHRLAGIYEKGIHIRRYSNGKLIEDRWALAANESKAVEWRTEAALAGNTTSMWILGTYHEEGKLGLSKNEREAQRWFDKLIDSGDSEQMLYLGAHYQHLYLNEHYLEKNIKRCIAWYEKAADFGNERALMSLGNIYWNEKFYIQDYSKALKYYERLVNRQKNVWTSDALFMIGRIYEDGDSTVKRDYDKALSYYKQAAAEGDKDAPGFIKDLEEKICRRDNSDCFITTATCNALGKPDDCYELTTFRNFRDTWLAAQPDGKKLIDEYYRVAPEIVRLIQKSPIASEIFRGIWQKYLKPCLDFIEDKEYEKCKETYMEMVSKLKNKFSD